MHSSAADSLLVCLGASMRLSLFKIHPKSGVALTSGTLIHGFLGGRSENDPPVQAKTHDPPPCPTRSDARRSGAPGSLRARTASSTLRMQQWARDDGGRGHHLHEPARLPTRLRRPPLPRPSLTLCCSNLLQASRPYRWDRIFDRKAFPFLMMPPFKHHR